jgi:hypothetical protein
MRITFVSKGAEEIIFLLTKGDKAGPMEKGNPDLMSYELR